MTILLEALGTLLVFVAMLLAAQFGYMMHEDEPYSSRRPETRRYAKVAALVAGLGLVFLYIGAAL